MLSVVHSRAEAFSIRRPFRCLLVVMMLSACLDEPPQSRNLCCAEDGVIDANDLRAKLGNDANVAELIKKADKNNDGQIDRLEFCEMLKSM